MTTERAEAIHDASVIGLLLTIMSGATVLVVGTIFNFVVWG